MPGLPFTQDQFLAVFAAYNEAVWPAQWVAAAAGTAIAVGAAFRTRWTPRAVPLALAALWAWTGVAYHGLFFAGINRAGLAFGALFVAQAVLFAAIAFRRGLRVGRGRGGRGVLGWLLAAYSLVAYPLLGIALGQSWPQLPAFGITPCPLVLFTFGVLLLATGPVPWWLMAVPAAWSLIGGSAAVLLRMPQDWVLLASGFAVVPVLLAGRRPRPVSATPAPAVPHAAER